MNYRKTYSQKSGFTLIELSIVLVIIGLIVGGVLVGRDLIRASEIRASISQIEKYQSAKNTFKAKYGELPGDMSAAAALQYNFLTRAGTEGRGDGNGFVEGFCYACGAPGYLSSVSYFYPGAFSQTGETSFFWRDLSAVSLVDGSFNTAPDANMGGSPIVLSKWYPAAKMGGNNYVYVWGFNSVNYFGLSLINNVNNTGDLGGVAGVGMTVAAAFNIDNKIDDGLPQSGRVIASYDNFNISPNAPTWAAGGGVAGASGGAPSYLPTTAATAGSATTCYDNNNVGGTAQQYSMTQNNGGATNCAISVMFQ